MYIFCTLFKKSVFFFSLAFKLLNDSQERRRARCVEKNNTRQGLYMKDLDNTGINVPQCKFQLVGKLLFYSRTLVALTRLSRTPGIAQTRSSVPAISLYI